RVELRQDGALLDEHVLVRSEVDRSFLTPGRMAFQAVGRDDRAHLVLVAGDGARTALGQIVGAIERASAPGGEERAEEQRPHRRSSVLRVSSSAHSSNRFMPLLSGGKM